MSDGAKLTMLLCLGLEPVEQAKVERLDGPIAELFMRAALVVRICQGRVADGQRFLDFCGPAGVVGSASAADFMAASDQAAVGAITLSGR